MKFVLLLTLCALAAAAAAPKISLDKELTNELANVEWMSQAVSDSSPQQRNILLNALIRQLIAYLRRVINNGSTIFGIPPLDPLEIEHFNLKLPLGLINLDLELDQVWSTGIGGFVVHRSNLNTRELTFDLDISVPTFTAVVAQYDLTGDLFTAIPLFGKGPAKMGGLMESEVVEAESQRSGAKDAGCIATLYGNGNSLFEMENLRLKGLLHLKRSDDGASVVIDSIENASFELPYFKSELAGVIGGGDIDAIVNAMIEDVVIDYVHRFHGAVSALGSEAIMLVLNPILSQLDTWRFIAPFVPSS